MWQYPQQKDKNCGVSAWKNKETSEKRILILCLKKNPYMKKIYPGDTKDAIEVFWLYEAQGEYFDISNPSNIVRIL